MLDLCPSLSGTAVLGLPLASASGGAAAQMSRRLHCRQAGQLLHGVEMYGCDKALKGWNEPGSLVPCSAGCVEVWGRGGAPEDQ